MKRVLCACLVAIVIVMVSCHPMPSPSGGKVEFRQYELEQLWQGDVGKNGYIQARFDDPGQVVDKIFATLPRVCLVYPTEGYYYFRAKLVDRHISGNFRIILSDSEPVSLSFAYFDIHEPRNFRSIVLSSGDGIDIARLADERFAITMGKNTREFRNAGSVYRKADSQVALHDGEELVTGVMDESGVWFSLIYNQNTQYFYYLRNPSGPSADQWAVVEEYNNIQVVQGIRTGFVVLRDMSNLRELLVGVRRSEVENNTFYDGPFDQVPPDLNIARQLRAAYPYVNEGGGIDRHGGFIDKENMRVAISPYQLYSRIDDFVKLCKIAIDESGEFANLHKRLCYETKRDYHTNKKAVPGALKRKWPANHYRTVSYSWEE